MTRTRKKLAVVAAAGLVLAATPLFAQQAPPGTRAQPVEHGQLARFQLRDHVHLAGLAQPVIVLVDGQQGVGRDDGLEVPDPPSVHQDSSKRYLCAPIR